MNRFKISPVLLLVILVFQGCSTPYYGHSKASWEDLSEEERTAIKKEYQFIIDSKKEQAHVDKIDARTQSVIDHGVEGPKY
jgi:PBP1b-binding outer membrane lipoprotein LpoB